jgi:acyl carrier protein
MSEFKELRFIPDWPRIRQLVAKRLGNSEDAVQAMADSSDSLNQVELTMAVEEVLDSLHR